jgi:hypothetical protein
VLGHRPEQYLARALVLPLSDPFDSRRSPRVIGKSTFLEGDLVDW